MLGEAACRQIALVVAMSAGGIATAVRFEDLALTDSNVDES